jgi:hypothetical protein
MKIKKFEAYNYRGPELKDLTRDKFIEEFIDMFIDEKICGYEVTGSSFNPEDEILYLYVYKNNIDKTIKLDLSDLGIEIGTQDWDENYGEPGEFHSEVNLNSDAITQMKSYKSDIKKYNV